LVRAPARPPQTGLSRPNRPHARVGFGRWRRVILLQHVAPERLKGAQRASAIPAPVQQRDERASALSSSGSRATPCRAASTAVGRSPFPLACSTKSAARRAASCPRRVRSAQSSVPAPGTHSTRNSHRGMRRDTVESLRGPPRLAGLFERGHVTPHRAGLERERFVTMAIEDANTELAAEKPQRLPQGPPSVRRVELGPKQRDHGVAAGTLISADGEIGEKARRFGWARIERTARPSIPFRSSVPSMRNSIIQPPRGRCADGGQVTLRSRLGH